MWRSIPECMLWYCAVATYSAPESSNALVKWLSRQSRVSRQGLFARRVPGQDADARELFEPELSV